MLKRGLLYLGLFCLVAMLAANGCGKGGVTTPDPGGTPSKTAMVDRHNNTRQADGAAALTENAILMQIAQNQADYMASTGNTTHEDATGAHVDGRATDAGYVWTTIGENIGFAADAETMYGLWLNSAPHLANITDTDYTEIGVGVALHGGYQYWCIVFGAQ